MSQTYRSQIVDHLGLVAGMFEELGIAEVIDHATPQDPEMRLVTAGHAVKAMVLNGVGFVNHQRYLVPHFFRNKPTSRLIAPAMQASHLNDETLGRTLDTLYASGVTELSSLIAATAAQRLGLAPRFAHLDSTSFHVDGRYNSDKEPTEHVMHIPRGYSRDHRPYGTVADHVWSDGSCRRQCPLQCRKPPEARRDPDAVDHSGPHDLERGPDRFGPSRAADDGASDSGLSLSRGAITLRGRRAALGSHLFCAAPAAGAAHGGQTALATQRAGGQSLQAVVS